MRGTLLVLVALALSLLAVLAFVPASSRAAEPPLLIEPVRPLPDATVASTTPTIEARFVDSAATVVTSSVIITVDGANVTGVDSTHISPSGVVYSVPALLRLSSGNHTVSIQAADTSGNHAEYSWGFIVNTTVTSVPLITVHPQTLLLYVGTGALAAAGIGGGYLLYIHRTRRFTFRRYFAVHPVQRTYLTLYVPVAVAFVFVLLAFIYVYNLPHPPLLAPEYIIVAGLFVALTAFAADTRRQLTRLRAYERAFAQFLFEMADAMRGGLDPAKSVTELAKTHTNILRRHLRIAADGIRLGKPFDSVLTDMVEPMRSRLISRYAALIADASSVGGETSTVVYRAAKDMDDFIKIEMERNRQLVMPVAILYIAFGVLMAVLFALLNIAPSLGSISLSIIGGSNPLNGAGGGAAAAPTVTKLTAAGLTQRFFDLMLINGIGTGVLIGAFTEGKVRFGLLHSLALAAATAIAFFLLFPL